MIISERIFKIMEEKGIRQTDFSAQTGISQSTISDWKRKKTNPSSDKIMVICETLGVSPYELLQDNNRDNTNEMIDYKVVSEGTDSYDLLVEFETEAVSLITLSSLKNRLEELLDTPVDVIHAPIPEGSILEIGKVVPLYAA